MAIPNRILNHINELITYLVKISLADDQCFAFQRPDRRSDRDIVQVTFAGAEHVSIALRDRSYKEIYQHLKQERAYNLKMLDGALIQMMYAFAGEMLQRHRLAFFPAPHLEEFQNNPDIYQDDEIYADVIAKNIVPFPVRFDYDARDGNYQEFVHPKSHLTLGQYEHCRIPVTSPMMPGRFIDFILRNFYHTASARYADGLPAQGGSFAESILPAERNVVHIVVPA